MYLLLAMMPIFSWGAIQQDILGTWHVEKVVCSTNNADLKYYNKIYFTFTVDGKFATLNPGLTNDNKKDPTCTSGEDTEYSVITSLDKTYLKLKSAIHKDNCGTKEYAIPAHTAILAMDADGNLRHSVPTNHCDNGKGFRTWILKKITL